MVFQTNNTLVWMCCYGCWHDEEKQTIKETKCNFLEKDS